MDKKHNNNSYTATMAMLNDHGLVRSMFEDQVQMRGSTWQEKGQLKMVDQGLDLLSKEMAVLRLSEKHQSMDLIEEMITLSRCALKRLETSTATSLLEVDQEESMGRDTSSENEEAIQASISALEEKAQEINDVEAAKELSTLPMNVQLGVHMLLRIIKTLNVSENNVALEPLLRKLPNLLGDLPPLALVENPEIAREVYIQTELKALKLDHEESLDHFQKRKARIKRQQERSKKSIVTCTANAGIPGAISQILEQAYTHRFQPVSRKGKLDQQASTIFGPPEASTFAGMNIGNGDLLSAILGLSIKRGSLSHIVSSVQHLFRHAEQVKQVHETKANMDQRREDEEEEKKDDEERENVVIQNRSLLSLQSAENDLDVEPYLFELAQATPAHGLRAFQKAEQGDHGGILFTFGKGDHGKLGHGRCIDVDPNPQPHMHEHCPDGNCTENIKTPRLVLDLEDLAIQKVASLSTHSVAMTTDGALYTWGNGDKNRLGHGSTSKEYYPKLVNALRSKPPVKDIACGLGHTLALLANGHVYAWGNGGNGRLGLGDTDDRAVATLVTKFIVDPAIEDVDQPNQQPPNPKHFKMPKDIEITGLYCGASHSMAVTKDGRCFSWGKNNQGQCGHGDVVDKLRPTLIKSLCKYLDDGEDQAEESKEQTEGKLTVETKPKKKKQMDPNWEIKCMAGGWEHTLALTRDGRLFSFGSGYKDSRRAGLPPVLGHGGTERELFPRQIFALQHENIAYCACGWDHSMAITSTGHVYTWGAGTNGKLGHGDEESCPLPKRVESLVEEGMHVVQVEAGCEHSVAVTDEGYLYTWGHGDSGRLGHPSSRTEKRPRRVEALVERGLPVLSIAVGDKYNLVLTDPGAVVDETKREEEQTKQENAPSSSSPSSLDGSIQPSFESDASHVDKNGKAVDSTGAELSSSLLNLSTFKMPEDDDQLLPDWMLSAERVGIFVLAHIESLATKTASMVMQSGAGNQEEIMATLKKVDTKTSRSAAQTIVIPGILEAWKNTTSGVPAPASPVDQIRDLAVALGNELGGGPATTNIGSNNGNESILDILQNGSQDEKVTLPYCVETGHEGIEKLVELLKYILNQCKQTKVKPQNCSCKADGDSAVNCCGLSWYCLWATLRIIKANLSLLPPTMDDALRDKRQASLHELHELLLDIVDSKELNIEYQNSSSLLKLDGQNNDNDSTKEKTCYTIDHEAKQQVVMVAAATIQVGFTRFYPTSESRLSLLKKLLFADGHSSAVLDVLMANLARDEAMMPLVLGMTRSGFDIYALLMDLLDNLDRPSHLKLLISFQTHAFTLWSHQDPMYDGIRDVLVRYSCNVLDRVNDLFSDESKADMLNVYLDSVLAPLLCTLIVTKPITDKMLEKIQPCVEHLFEKFTIEQMDGEKSNFATCFRLVARLAGRLICCGSIEFPMTKSHRELSRFPVLLFAKHHRKKLAFPSNLVSGVESAKETDMRVRQQVTHARSGFVNNGQDLDILLEQALCALRIQNLELDDQAKYVEVYSDMIQALASFFEKASWQFDRDLIKSWKSIMLENARALVLAGIALPADMDDGNKMLQDLFEEDAHLQELLSQTRFPCIFKVLLNADLTDDETIQAIQNRSGHSTKSLQGLKTLASFVRVCRSNDTIVNELLFHLPYAVATGDTSVLGNPEAIKVGGSGEGEDMSLFARKDASEDMVIVAPLAQVDPDQVIDILCELIRIDKSANALTTTVFLLTNINYAGGFVLQDKHGAILMEALSAKLKDFYHVQTNAYNVVKDSMQTPAYVLKCIYSLSIVIRNSKPDTFPQSNALLLTWIEEEMSRCSFALQKAYGDEEKKWAILRKTHANYLVHQLEPFLVSQAPVTSSVVSSGMNSARKNGSQKKNGGNHQQRHHEQSQQQNAQGSNGTRQQRIPSLVPTVEVLDIDQEADENDDLDRAVESVLLRGGSGFDSSQRKLIKSQSRKQSLVPPDDISSKSFSVSFNLNLKQMPEEESCRVIFSRAQRRDEENEKSKSDYPFVNCCEAHSVVLHPAIILRRTREGKTYLDGLISTIVLKDGQRTTLIEYCSAEITETGKWYHASVNVNIHSRTMTIYLDGKLEGSVDLKGQVLRKCSSHIPVRVGGLNQSATSANMENQCNDKCSLDIFESFLQSGATHVMLSDLIWHSSGLEREDVLDLHKLPQNYDLYDEKAKIEKDAMTIVRLLLDHQKQVDGGKSKKTYDSLLALFKVSKWLELQKALLEAVNVCPGEEVDKYFSDLFARIWFTETHCQLCGDYTHLISGYEPTMRSTYFKRRAELSRLCNNAYEEYSEKDSSFCHGCKILSTDLQYTPHYQAMLNHRFGLQNEVVGFFQRRPVSETILRENPSLYVLTRAGVLNGTYAGQKVKLMGSNEQGVLLQNYDASRLLRTYCLQQHYKYLRCHTSIFHLDETYDFLVPKEAAIVAVQIARRSGFIATPEPGSPKSAMSPRSPGRLRLANQHKNIWNLYGSQLVAKDLSITDMDRDLLLQCDFEKFCENTSSFTQHPHQQHGPKAWNLNQVSAVQVLDEDDEPVTKWVLCSQLCCVGVDEVVYMNSEEDSLELLRSSLTFFDSCDTKEELNEKATVHKVVHQANLLQHTLRGLITSDQPFKGQEELMQKVLELAICNKNEVMQKAEKYFSNVSGSTLKGLLRFVNANYALPPRTLQVLSQTCWERIQVNFCVRQSKQTKVDSPKVDGLDGNATTEESMTNNNHKVKLESMGEGKVQIGHTTLIVQGVDHESSVYLGNSAHNLEQGRFYYEVSLLTDEWMNIGLSDGTNMFAIDGYKGNLICADQEDPITLDSPWNVGDIVGVLYEQGNITFSLNEKIITSITVAEDSLPLFPAVKLGMGQSLRFIFTNFQSRVQLGDGEQSFVVPDVQFDYASGQKDNFDDENDDEEQQQQQQQQAVAPSDNFNQQQRQLILETLLATGLPENIVMQALDETQNVSSYDENATIAYIMKKLVDQETSDGRGGFLQEKKQMEPETMAHKARIFKDDEFSIAGENTLFELVENCKETELPIISFLLDSTLAIEYARSVFIKAVSSCCKTWKPKESQQIVRLFMLSLGTGETFLEYYGHSTIDSIKAMLKVLLDENPSLHEQLLQHATKSIEAGSSSKYESVQWFASYDKKAYELACAENGWNGKPRLLLSDEDALSEPNVEACFFLLNLLMDHQNEE